MYTKGLIIIPSNGFANRMRMICSCHILCEYLNIPYYIKWVVEPECIIELKNVIDGFSYIDEIIGTYLYFGKVHTNEILNKIEANQNTYDYLILLGGNKIKLERIFNDDFIFQKHLFYKNLKFKNCITKYKLNYEYISIHYRTLHNDQYTGSTNDKLNFENNSPIEKYNEILDTFTNTYNLPIVVFTNGINSLNLRWKNNIIYSNDINDINGINNAITDVGNKDVIDFYRLGQIKLIIGSYFSSFSDEAVWMNNICKIIPYNYKGPNDKGTTDDKYHCYGYNTYSIENLKISYKCINNNVSFIHKLLNIDINNNLNLNPKYSIPTRIEKNTILVIVKKVDSIFTNGCIQQAYFLYKLLKHTGYNIELATPHKDYTKFELVDIPVRYISNTSNNLHDVFLIINVSMNINDIVLYKLYNIYVITLVCGNLYILHQEDYVHKCFNVLNILEYQFIDEFWVLPMYKFSLDYIKLLYRKQVHLLPYIWDSDIVEKYIKLNNLNIHFSYNQNKPLNIAIFEPNMSIHKTALIPLLISNELYESNESNELSESSINKVYIFCSSDNIKNSNVNNLKIVRDGKVEYYNRIVLFEALQAIRKSNEDNTIIISHNIMNELNFLHLELMYLGYPVVHNCEPYKNNKLYYNSFKELEAVNIIKKLNSILTSQTYNIKNIYNEISSNYSLKNN